MVDTSFQNIQEWLQTVLLSRGDLSEKLDAGIAKTGLDIYTTVKATRGISKYIRLDIYASGYVLRLLACLKVEYPLLCDFMGEELFELFAKAHIVTAPSQSWSLQYLGKEFPKFLALSKPEIELKGEQKDRIEIPIALAVFERAKSEVMIAPGLEEVSTDSSFNTIQHMFGLNLQTISLRSPSCLQLLSLNYAVHTYTLKEEQERPQYLTYTPTFLALSRMNYRLQIVTLTNWQYELLMLSDNTMSIHEALVIAAKACHLKVQDVVPELMLWLNTAFEKGLLY